MSIPDAPRNGCQVTKPFWPLVLERTCWVIEIVRFRNPTYSILFLRKSFEKPPKAYNATTDLPCQTVDQPPRQIQCLCTKSSHYHRVAPFQPCRTLALRPSYVQHAGHEINGNEAKDTAISEFVKPLLALFPKKAWQQELTYACDDTMLKKSYSNQKMACNR